MREWLKQNSPDAEQDDPPIRCQLTDLSLGGCYLEISSPFPASSRVTLSMRAGGVEVRAQGVVRVMHPDKGMGVEFTQATPEHRAAVGKFLGVLSENRTLLPELLVEPEGLESDPAPPNATPPTPTIPYCSCSTEKPSRSKRSRRRCANSEPCTPPAGNGAAAGASA